MFPSPGEPLLSAEARRGYIAHSIKRSTWTTQSGASILRSLQEAGIGIRETEFYALRREVLSLGYYEEQITRLRPDTLIPRGWMDERETTVLTCKAQYRFRLAVTDLVTGEQETITRAIASDRHMTRQEAEDMIRGLFTMPSATSNYTIDAVTTTEVWVRPGAILDR